MEISGAVESALSFLGETLTLRQESGGSFNTTTEAWSSGSNVDTSTFGRVKLITQGVDGMTVLRGDLEVWLPRRPLADAGVTPRAGDVLIRALNSQQLRILEIQNEPVGGFYRCRARGVSA